MAALSHFLCTSLVVCSMCVFTLPCQLAGLHAVVCCWIFCLRQGWHCIMQGAAEPMMAQHNSHSAPVLNSNSKSSSSSKTLAQVWVDAAATASPGQHASVCT